MVGGKGGKGVASCRQADGSMSAPAMYEIGGASIGFQFGGSSTDFVLLVMNKEGMNYLAELERAREQNGPIRGGRQELGEQKSAGRSAEPARSYRRTASGDLMTSPARQPWFPI